MVVISRVSLTGRKQSTKGARHQRSCFVPQPDLIAGLPGRRSTVKQGGGWFLVVVVPSYTMGRSEVRASPSTGVRVVM